MPEEDRPESRRSSRLDLFWCVLITAVATGLITLVVITTVLRPHQVGIGVWFSDFFKTSGFAGLCALGAAGLAFWGISRQLGVTRAGLEQTRSSSAQSLDMQRQTDANRSWWDTFEWATSRAIPASSDDDPLPYVAVLSTFEALAQSASTDVQRASIAGVMDEAARRNESSVEDTEGAADPDGRDRVLAALENFVSETSQTRASSKVVESQLYEGLLLASLEELDRDGAVGLRSYRDANRKLSAHEAIVHPDAVVVVDGVTIALEARNFSTAGALYQSRVVAQVRRYLDHGGVDVVAIVSPVAPAGVTELDRDVSAVRWVMRDAPSRLLEDLRTVARSVKR